MSSSLMGLRVSFFPLQKGIVCRRLRDRVAVKGANDRRGTCVNRSNEGSRGLGLVGLREEGLF